MNDFRMHVSIKGHSPILNISMQIIVNRCRSQLLMNFLFSLYTCIFKLFYLLNSSWVSKFTDVLLLYSLKVSSLKFTLASVSDKRILRSLYTLWSTCLNTIYHHYRHHHRFATLYWKCKKRKSHKKLSIRNEKYLLKYLTLGKSLHFPLLNCTR